MTRLTFEYDPEPYGKERDGAVLKMAQQFGVETIVRNSHTLYNLDRWRPRPHPPPPAMGPWAGPVLSAAPVSRIVEANNSSPPLTFKRFQSIVSRLELPRRPLPSVTRQQVDRWGTPVAQDHEQLYSIPSLEELGSPAHKSSRA